MDSNVPSIVVGLHLEPQAPKYYLRFVNGAAGIDGATCGHVREMLAQRLLDLDAKANALRDVLASSDPETIERTLCDGTQLAVTEVVVRPQNGRAALVAFLEHRFAPHGA